MRSKNISSLENEENVDSIAQICSLLAEVSDEHLIYDFFGCLFTNSELKDFSNRWHLVKELRAGTTQREIARKYGMSLCNITRGSRELKKENSAFKRMLALLDARGEV
ncbi:MAG: transcriptional regulator [Treponema sp.]|nr:transcriptional regulator [Treponema sp.]